MEIHYKFLNSHSYTATSFDADRVTVFDLKKRIMQERNFERGADFHLRVRDPITKQEYMDDEMLSAAQEVIARREPAHAPGEGTAQRYAITCCLTFSSML